MWRIIKNKILQIKNILKNIENKLKTYSVSMFLYFLKHLPNKI